MIDLRSIARVLGGVVSSGQVLAPGPGHGHRDRSLTVRLSPTAREGLVVFSHAGDDWRACRDYVFDRLGIARRFSPAADDPLAWLQARARQVEAERAEEALRRERTAKAQKLWNEAEPAEGTLVERYLAGRGLELPPDAAARCLRFHPAGPWGLGRVPMMVGAMRGVMTGDVQAAHRTALSEAGEKIDRRMLGPVSGAAIMLSAATEALVVGEGIESTLSAIAIGYGPGVWAMGSAGAISGLPVLPGIQRLILLEERDETSAKAVSDCGHRWARAGRTVTVVLPTSGSDLNDALKRITR